MKFTNLLFWLLLLVLDLKFIFFCLKCYKEYIENNTNNEEERIK